MSWAGLLKTKSIEQIKRDAESGEFVRVTLRRTLGVFDLTMLGIAAIIGAGIFAMIGNAASRGGPAVVLLFIFAAIACAFSALCYAEFASRIPIAGSAYTYAYASLGELIAWIIGWDLIVEYAIGNIAVAISWSDYFTGMLKGYGINLPSYLTMDYLSAYRSFNESSEAVVGALASGYTLSALLEMSSDSLTEISDKLTPSAVEAYAAWTQAPMIGNLRLIADLPALMITVLITALVYIGIRESKVTANVMTVLKVAVILLVIVLGAFYVNPANWSPFAPNGFAGVMSGAAAVFFAYIGFDALSTTAEECRNPHRDLPRGMILSLFICTVLYCLLALVLTGMVSYKKLAVGDPLAFVFGPDGANLPWIAGIIAVSAVIAMATVFLVFQIGQPRLWMAMSRDGLLPPIFSSIHPRFRTPWFSTIVTGLVVAIPALFLNLTEVTDLTVIGTLFAFSIVCAGVLFKDKEFSSEKRFVPYINGRYFVPIIMLIVLGLVYYFNNEAFWAFLTRIEPKEGETLWQAFSHKIPTIAFIILATVVTILSVVKKLSLIPVLGLLCCTYLMSELGWTNWLRFAVWLLLGLSIYFGYGYVHSKIGREENRPETATSYLKLASFGFLLAAFGIAISAFDFINGLIIYVFPFLDGILRFIEIGLAFFGLLMGIYGAFSQIKKPSSV
ncbi:MAG: amino acid permease [Pyrinomonadaceae bacterium]|nr:amino acid permease [Pyrinomonadaceae bacterium]MCX7639846.1 amino acid permease [Pyrinomonadaceae bacterium]MDW8304018.1 amino acid permease [Acidobacteriota bacterium]